MIIASNVAIADKRIYIGGELAGAQIQAMKLRSADKVYFRDSPLLGIVVGVKLNQHWHIETQFSISRLNQKNVDISPLKRRLIAYQSMNNIYYYFSPKRYITPYLGAGFGTTLLQSDYQQDKHWNSASTWQAVVGAAMYTNAHWTIAMDLRYKKTDHFAHKIIKDGLESVQLNTALHYTF